MRKIWRKLFGTAALALMLCLAGLIMSGEAQAERLVDNRNGTVTDTVTGLMWTYNANPFFRRWNWHDAMSRCESFSINGIGGWRLPSKDELVAIYHAIKGGHPFVGVQSDYYWSSTTFTVPTEGARVVNMGNGYLYNGHKTGTDWVWCVRTGQ